MEHYDVDDVDDPDADYDPIMQMDPIHPDRLEYDAERARRKHLLIIRRRRIRDFADPFDVTLESFVKSYRLTQDLVFSLVDLIRPHVVRTSSALALPLEKKVLAVLAFYGAGSYQTPTGKNFEICVAQPTMSNYIDEITQALNSEEIVGRFIRFPSTAEEIDFCVERNRRLGGKIPGTIGYIDGSLVKIRKPSVENNRHAFMGRKGFASVNVQFVCDRRLYINNVLARFPGSTNDSFIFNSSGVRENLVELHPLRPNCHLIGDSGYALEPWLMTPFARDEEPEDGTPEDRFNRILCHDRSIVENAIGRVKGVFRAVDDERVLHYDPVKTCRIVVAITVLHNLRVLCQVPLFEDAERLDQLRNDNVHGGGVEEDEGPEEAAAVRRLLARAAAHRQRIVQQLEEERRARHQHQD